MMGGKEDGRRSLLPVIAQNSDYGVNQTETQGNRTEGSGRTDSANETEKTKKWTKQQWVILCFMCLASLLSSLGFSLMAAFFPDEAVRKGSSDTENGLIFASFSFVTFLVAPFVGKKLTTIGSKFGFVSGLICAGFVSAMYGTLLYCPNGVTFVVTCFVVRCCEALWVCLYLTSMWAIIARTFSGQVSYAFGITETFTGLGYSVGPPLGGLLYEVGGFLFPFVLIGGIMVACGVASYFILPSVSEERKNSEGSMLKLIRIPSVAIISFATFAVAAAYSFVEPILERRLDSFDLSTTEVGLMFLIISAAYTLSSPTFGKITDYCGKPRLVCCIGIFIFSISCLTLGPAPFLPIPDSVWVTAISLFFYGVSGAQAMIPTYEVMFEGALSQGFEDNFETHGFISGLFNSVFSLGACVSPLYAGALMEYFGFGYACTTTAAILFVAGVMVIADIVRTSLNSKPSSEEQTEQSESDGLVQIP